MRVLIVTPDYPPPPGGIQTLTKNLEKGLDLLGHETQILHLEPGDNTFPEDWFPSVKISHPMDLKKWPYFNYVFKQTKKNILQFSPHILHITHILCWPALKAANDLNVSRTVSTHALELENTRLAKSAASQAQNFHAVSQFTAELTKSVTNINGAKIDVVPPSISIPTSIPDPTPGGPVFTISRLVKRKNVETIIDAWQLLPQYIRQKHGLIIAGEGDQRPLLEIKSSNDDTIQVLGRVSNEMKEMLLRDAAVFSLVPVQDGFDVEGFGIVYLEAQASGTPVVGSSTGGVPEAVGDAGILVDSPRDSEAVATALKELLTNETTRRSCYNSINNRIQDFDIKHVAQEHVSRYQELL